MCSWTSKYAILRDLSEAQGHVPTEIKGTVGAEPPPTLLLTEETEEEFFANCIGAGDCVVGKPDLGLIRKMLDMVKDVDSTLPESGDGDGKKTVMSIQKFNERCPDFVAKNVNVKTNNKTVSTKKIVEKDIDNDKKAKPKKARNVALISLLDALNKNENKDPLNLMKPNNFIDSNVSESLVKVDDWLNSQVQNESTNGKKVPNLTPITTMFKRKTNVVKQSNETAKSVATKKENYTPSGLATEYYKKYVEKSKLNNCIREDIWTKTERVMREADAKKKAELVKKKEVEESRRRTVELAQQEGNKEKTCTILTIDQDKFHMVGLPQHRHNLTEDCIVCSRIFIDNNKHETVLITL
ncbi:uncharacterized protein LOC128200387 [Galleria mellonella]|uniref:Uncharacterized protein LOC128200387 n=1 Tax=Galleria mellonella TaxID=7137 RepID=A0ABM3ME25_GALME|nr:uncharacterized protein LOC128200387 [Galleria mellonella]